MTIKPIETYTLDKQEFLNNYSLIEREKNK